MTVDGGRERAVHIVHHVHRDQVPRFYRHTFTKALRRNVMARECLARD